MRQSTLLIEKLNYGKIFKKTERIWIYSIILWRKAQHRYFSSRDMWFYCVHKYLNKSQHITDVWTATENDTRTVIIKLHHSTQIEISKTNKHARWCNLCTLRFINTSITKCEHSRKILIKENIIIVNNCSHKIFNTMYLQEARLPRKRGLDLCILMKV